VVYVVICKQKPVFRKPLYTKMRCLHKAAAYILKNLPFPQQALFIDSGAAYMVIRHNYGIGALRGAVPYLFRRQYSMAKTGEEKK